jgi:hypothetical protein
MELVIRSQTPSLVALQADLNPHVVMNSTMFLRLAVCLVSAQDLLFGSLFLADLAGADLSCLFHRKAQLLFWHAIEVVFSSNRSNCRGEVR